METSKLFINGSFVPSTGTDFIDVIDSTTEEVMGSIPEGTVADVDVAVRAAADAQPQWAALPQHERSRYLMALHDELNNQAELLTNLIAREVGTPIKLGQFVQVGVAIAAIKDAVDALEAFAWETPLANSTIVREPIGVVGAITPWNYPLYQILLKIAPAMGVGCCVVLKPSEVAPLNAYVIAEAIQRVGFPPGVFNLVTGIGPVVGEALASHPLVDAISFTGSTRAGKRVMQLGAETIKRVNLELGGKSACVILDDANLAKAVSAGVNNVLLNSGQTCAAWTRMIVPRRQLGDVEQLAVEAMAKFAPGSPFTEGKVIGPLVSAAQRDRVRNYIKSAIEEGARLILGGADQPEGLESGYFVQPTIFTDVSPEMTIAREEIFGPVLSIMAVDSDDEAVALANATPYGLHGGVWSEKAERAERVARAMKTGQVDINGGRFNPLAPFGGYRQSGNGRERGHYGLEEFLEIKAIQH